MSFRVEERRAGDWLWRVVGDSALEWQCWGDECVVYFLASGDTHLFSGFGAAALKVLAEGPVDGDALTRQVAAVLDREADAELADAVEALIVEFARLGVTERYLP